MEAWHYKSRFSKLAIPNRAPSCHLGFRLAARDSAPSIVFDLFAAHHSSLPPETASESGVREPGQPSDMATSWVSWGRTQQVPLMPSHSSVSVAARRCDSSSNASIFGGMIRCMEGVLVAGNPHFRAMSLRCIASCNIDSSPRAPVVYSNFAEAAHKASNILVHTWSRHKRVCRAIRLVEGPGEDKPPSFPATALVSSIGPRTVEGF